MPSTLTQVQAQTLRRLLREYLDCITGWSPSNCEVLRNAVRSLASSVNGELARDALRLVEAEGYEP